MARKRLSRKREIQRDRNEALGKLAGARLFTILFGLQEGQDAIDEWHRRHLPNGDKREYMSNWVLGA